MYFSGILFEGRTSRMNRSLVDEQELALAAISLNGFPGDKHTTLFGAVASAESGCDPGRP